MPTFGQDQEEEAFCELGQRFVDQREIMEKAFHLIMFENQVINKNV